MGMEMDGGYGGMMGGMGMDMGMGGGDYGEDEGMRGGGMGMGGMGGYDDSDDGENEESKPTVRSELIQQMTGNFGSDDRFERVLLKQHEFKFETLNPAQRNSIYSAADWALSSMNNSDHRTFYGGKNLDHWLKVLSESSSDDSRKEVLKKIFTLTTNIESLEEKTRQSVIQRLVDGVKDVPFDQLDEELIWARATGEPKNNQSVQAKVLSFFPPPRNQRSTVLSSKEVQSLLMITDGIEHPNSAMLLLWVLRREGDNLSSQNTNVLRFLERMFLHENRLIRERATHVAIEMFRESREDRGRLVVPQINKILKSKDHSNEAKLSILLDQMKDTKLISKEGITPDQIVLDEFLESISEPAQVKSIVFNIENLPNDSASKFLAGVLAKQPELLDETFEFSKSDFGTWNTSMGPTDSVFAYLLDVLDRQSEKSQRLMGKKPTYSDSSRGAKEWDAAMEYLKMRRDDSKNVTEKRKLSRILGWIGDVSSEIPRGPTKLD
jgi:hypothetical protein